MGNANKKNQSKNSSILATGKSTGGKKEMPTWIGTLIVVSVLVVLILICTFSALSSRGTFVRGKAVAESDNFKITVPMMSYLVYTEYQNFVNQYQTSGYMPYIKGTGGESLNTQKNLRDQKYSVVKDEKTGATTVTTWFDYFASRAAGAANQTLIFCEYANHFGITLNKEEMKEIDDAISYMELYAKASGHTLSSYYASMYGRGVTEKDVRRMMELSSLSAKYAEQRQAEIEASLTEPRIHSYYEEHQKDFDIAIDYISHSFVATFKPVASTEEGAAEKNAEALAAYKEKQKLYQERVDALKACTSVEEYSNLLLSYFKADYTGEGDADAEALKLLEKATHQNYEKGEGDSDGDSWLFPENPRKKFDTTTMVEAKDGYDVEKQTYVEASSTYDAYMVTAVLHANNDVVRSVGHILFKTDTFKDMTNTDKLNGVRKVLAQKLLDKGLPINAENMAKELLLGLEADHKLTKVRDKEGRVYYTIDKSVFEEYGNSYTEDGNVFYDDVKKGDMVEEFENWLFDENRVSGEITFPDAVKTKYGYHIMFYVGDEKEKWYADVFDALYKADYDSWYKTATETYKITFTQKNWNKISG